jgi:tRNA-specific 2-thiouridylase
VTDRDGSPVGRHEGVAGFTVGQRRGLGVALGEPAYVTAIEPDSGTVQVGRRDDLRRTSCSVGGVNWLAAPPDGGADDLDVEVQLRHHHRPERARLSAGDGGRVTVAFDQPSEAVTPGQYAVFYSGDRVLGSGRILRDEGPPSARPSIR